MKRPNPSLPRGALLALLALLVIAGSAAGCGGSRPSGADASALLAEAVPPMKALSSFHFTYSVTRPQDTPPPAGTQIVSITGDVSLQGLMKATVDLDTGGVPLQFSFVATNDVHYVQNPASQKWQSVPAALSPVGRLNLSAGAVLILERVRQPVESGTERVSGVTCVRVTGKIAAEDLAELVAAADTKELLDCTIWVGKDDHLVRRIQTVGAAVANEDRRLQRLIELSAFNEPVDITIPSSIDQE